MISMLCSSKLFNKPFLHTKLSSIYFIMKLICSLKVYWILIDVQIFIHFCHPLPWIFALKIFVFYSCHFVPIWCFSITVECLVLLTLLHLYNNYFFLLGLFILSSHYLLSFQRSCMLGFCEKSVHNVAVWHSTVSYEAHISAVNYASPSP